MSGRGASAAAASPSLPRQAIALGGGAVGALAWSGLGLPLPWMVGAMVGGLVVGHLALRPAIDGRARALMMVVIGIVVGSAVPADVIEAAAGWRLTLVLVAVYTLVATGLGLLFMRRLAGYRAPTAFCMAAPGGFLELVAVARSLGADPERTALVHAVRIVVVILLVPPLMVAVSPPLPAATGTDPATGALGLRDAAILGGCALGAPVFRRLGVPGALMVAPMLLSAAAYLAGWIEARPPHEVLLVAQWVVGTALGCGIAALRPMSMARATLAGLGLVGVLLAVSVVFTGLTVAATGLPANVAFLLFAPGSTPEMVLIALALDIEPAMVAGHHLLRLIIVVALAPVGAALLRGMEPRAAAPPS